MLAAMNRRHALLRRMREHLKQTGPGLMVDKKELSVPIRCFVSPSRSWGATAVADVLDEAALRQAPRTPAMYAAGSL